MLLSLLHETDCVATRILLTLNISLQKLYQDYPYLSLAWIRKESIRRKCCRSPAERKKGRTAVWNGSDRPGKRRETGSCHWAGRRDWQADAGIKPEGRRTIPCLVGEPGVGKTAVIEGLAAKDRIRNRSGRNEG